MSAALPRNQIIVGDALTELRKLPDGSVDMVFYSPPYLGLRDYDAGPLELGQERTADAWVDNQVAVALEGARVLVPTGTLWINAGDTYSATPGMGAPRKSLLLGPSRLALRLIKAGLLLRNDICWAKPNHLPSPVRDRLTNAWEHLFMFAKSPRYYFDLDAIRIPHTSRAPRAKGHPPGRHDSTGPGRSKLGSSGLARMKAEGRVGHPLGKSPGDVWTIPTSQYRGAHRATMPTELARRVIAATCPELRCIECRAPWKRTATTRALGRAALRPTCQCEADVEPGIVLDPFMGSGTTAVAAQELGRDWLGVELNGDYTEQATSRICRSRQGS